MNDAELKVWFEEHVGALITYAQTTERILAAMGSVTDVANRIKEIAENDAEMAPEVYAAIGHLVDAGEALQRAYRFGATRMDVKVNG
jgi:rubrerythrin